jgi:hypothetical protein
LSRLPIKARGTVPLKKKQKFTFSFLLFLILIADVLSKIRELKIYDDAKFNYSSIVDRNKL